jgi:hypothetical protein
MDMQELDKEALESLDALRSLRAAVAVLKTRYSKDDIESFVARAYGDSGKVICPPPSARPSQPRVSSLPPDQKLYIAP